MHRKKVLMQGVALRGSVLVLVEKAELLYEGLSSHYKKYQNYVVSNAIGLLRRRLPLQHSVVFLRKVSRSTSVLRPAHGR